jgi:SAM-dependent methyltransferase
LQPGQDSFQRFESRAGHYARHRATYPPALIDCLAQAQGWRAGLTVADVGSGTGIFTRLVLERGPCVLAIEPGAAMRAQAEQRLAAFPGFVSLDATAEATTLPDVSVDAIVCAQAFHWFNHERTRAEWRRILRPGGSAALIWNILDDRDAMTRDYLDVLYATSPDARAVIGSSSGCAWRNVLFDGSRGRIVEFAQAQPLDLDGLIGRTESVSYAPKPGTAAHTALLAGMGAVFRAHARDGRVRLAYRTVAVHGPLE